VNKSGDYEFGISNSGGGGLRAETKSYPSLKCTEKGVENPM